MSKLLIFGGTTEGRELAHRLADHGFLVTLSVATDHGAAMVGEKQGLTVYQGRLDQQEITMLLHEGEYAGVVDATHPFAEIVSQNIKTSAQQTQTPYYRLVREESRIKEGKIVCSNQEAVEVLEQTQGSVLLTTGSKGLAEYTTLTNFSQRMYPRILPMVSSVERALELGYHPRRILALQGPFSKAFNKALIEEYNIQVLVTKDSGKTGGFLEKVEAAKETGISLVILRRPEETGYSLEELWQQLTGGEQ